MPLSIMPLGLPLPACGTALPPLLHDADFDDAGHRLFVLGDEARATHLLFGSGRLVSLPEPLAGCAARLHAPDEAFVIGWRGARSSGTVTAGFVGETGATRPFFYDGAPPLSVLCTGAFVVLGFGDDFVHSSDPVASEGLVVLDLEGTILWGWNSSVREVDFIDDCEAIVRLDGNLIGVCPGYSEPLTMLDVAAGRLRAVHHPLPQELRPVRAISARDDTWYFVSLGEDPNTVFAWCPEDRHARSGKPARIGCLSPDRRYRGLPNGRFLGVGRHDAVLVEPS